MSPEKLRWRAVTMVRGGATQVATAMILGVHKNTVSLWPKWWREGGDAALKPKRRDRTGRKQAQMIEMLKRPEGATVEQIAEATGLAAPE
jgi:transposase